MDSQQRPTTGRTHTSSKRRSNRSSVPVARREVTGVQPKVRASKPAFKIGPKEIFVVAAVLILMLLATALPLRNYFQQRHAIVTAQQAIESKQEEKQQLIEEIERYQSEDYIREEARNRLGVIQPGESAYRIIDPEMKREHATRGRDPSSEKHDPWFEQLWGQVAGADDAVADRGSALGQ